MKFAIFDTIQHYKECLNYTTPSHQWDVFNTFCFHDSVEQTAFSYCSGIYFSDDVLFNIMHHTEESLWGLDRIDAPLNDESYFADWTGKGVSIYILDSGIDTSNHEFTYASNIYDDYDEIKVNNDVNGHGTHVAGIIGGRNMGVSPLVNLFGIKVLNDAGIANTHSIINGLEVAYNHAMNNVSIVVLPFSGVCDGLLCDNDPINHIIDNFFTPHGIVVVAATGNDCDSCIMTPGSSFTSITVGATDIHDKITDYTSFGSCVDIYAPGDDIYSLAPNSEHWISQSGTSQSTAFVAGIAAQWLEMDPMLRWNSSQLLRSALQEMGDDLTTYQIAIVNDITSIEYNLDHISVVGCDRGWVGPTCDVFQGYKLSCMYGYGSVLFNNSEKGDFFTLSVFDNIILQEETLCEQSISQYCLQHEIHLSLAYCAESGYLYNSECNVYIYPNQHFTYFLTELDDCIVTNVVRDMSFQDRTKACLNASSHIEASDTLYIILGVISSLAWLILIYVFFRYTGRKYEKLWQKEIEMIEKKI